jgi:hypothetical protein
MSDVQKPRLSPVRKRLTCGAVELCAQKAARGCDGRAAQHPMRQRTHTWRHATGVIRRGSELRLRCASAGRRRSRRRFSAALPRTHRVACGALVLHVRAERRDLFVVERQVLRARHRPDGPAPQGVLHTCTRTRASAHARTHAHARARAHAPGEADWCDRRVERPRQNARVEGEPLVRAHDVRRVGPPLQPLQAQPWQRTAAVAALPHGRVRCVSDAARACACVRV